MYMYMYIYIYIYIYSGKRQDFGCVQVRIIEALRRSRGRGVGRGRWVLCATRRHRANRPRRPTFSTLVGHLRPSEVTLVATCCEEVSKLTPRSAKIAQHSAKMRQNSAKMGQDRLPERP